MSLYCDTSLVLSRSAVSQAKALRLRHSWSKVRQPTDAGSAGLLGKDDEVKLQRSIKLKDANSIVSVLKNANQPTLGQDSLWTAEREEGRVTLSG
jgi:hypothetical protein